MAAVVVTDRGHTCVAIFSEQIALETVTGALSRAGGSHRRLSLIRLDTRPPNSTALWDAPWDSLSDAAQLWLPGVGPVTMAGPLVGVLMAALEEAAALGGLSALGMALYHTGIAAAHVARYEAAVKTGRSLIMLQGDLLEVERGYNVFMAAGAREVAIHWVWH
jgi:hypothetical protein